MSNLWRVRTALSGGSGSAQVSTMFFDQAAGLTAQGAANAVHAFWVTVADNMSSSYTAQVELAVEDIDIATGKPTGVTAVTAGLVTGTQSADPLPWATQALVSWRSGTFVSGREVRGRTFIPGMVETLNSSGVPSGSIFASINGAASTLAGDSNSSLCIYSRKKAAVGIVTSGSMWTKWAVLRSRRD